MCAMKNLEIFLRIVWCIQLVAIPVPEAAKDMACLYGVHVTLSSHMESRKIAGKDTGNDKVSFPALPIKIVAE